jgi:hypothetical protein
MANTSDMETLQEPRALVAVACRYAASERAASHADLLSYLDSRDFLLRLNSEQEYVSLPPKHLHVARVIKTLMDSPHPVSKNTIVALTGARNFRSFEQLEDLLVRALAEVRPSPPQAIAYWDKHSQPESDNLHLVIEAIFTNGSDPALALFERKIADEGQEVECRTIWLRDPMLRHRNDIAVLQCCERMVVQGTVPGDMRVLVVEALCDYQRDWYLACSKPRPPLRVLASSDSRKILRSICEFAKDKLSLSPEQQIAVETTLAELGGSDTDAFRRGDKP